MKTNFSTARNCAKSPLAKGAALLTALLLAASVQVKADTITNYDYVDDVIGNSSISGTPSDYGFGLKLAEITNFPGPFSGEITAWDPSNNSSYSDLYSKSRNDANSLNTEAIIGTALPTERQFNFSRSSNVSVFGVYSTSRVRRRNFRINSTSADYFSVPQGIGYSNIADGEIYTSLPVVTTSDGQILGTGFTGSAIGKSTSNDAVNLDQRRVNQVYLSLERISDGAYWNGNDWSHLRINHLASLVATPRSFGSSTWTSVGWPTGGALLNGQYRLRTMATLDKRGRLNTITFTIDKSAKTYYKIVNRRYYSMYMYDAGDNPSYNTLQSTVYSQSPALFEWELLPVPDVAGYVSIKNRATGDILHISDNTGFVQCTNVPSSRQSSMWLPTDVDSGYKIFENRKQPGNFFRIGANDGNIRYGPLPAEEIRAHWGLEPFTASSNSVSSASAATSSAMLSGGAS